MAREALTRTIVHVDMDAFFASVEQRDRPELRGKPVIVGGDPFGRGVVSTASYEARKFGVRSAMPSSQARRLCPQGIFLRPNFARYQEASDAVQAILRQHTDLVEPVSLDEAYLDVTRHRLGLNDGAMIASLIKQNILAVTKLTASAGVAPNMFLSKIASDLKKPDGLVVIKPGSEREFLKDLSVRKIPGVGPVTEAQLAEAGIRTCSDVLDWKPSKLRARFGNLAGFLIARAQGLDDREVVSEWIPKQSSTEETFERDTKDVPYLKRLLEEYAKTVFEDVRRGGLMGKTVVLKVKYFDFESITRSHTLTHAPRGWEDLYHAAAGLLETKTLAGEKPVRLLGLGLAGLREAASGPVERDLFS